MSNVDDEGSSGETANTNVKTDDNEKKSNNISDVRIVDESNIVRESIVDIEDESIQKLRCRSFFKIPDVPILN